MRQWQGQSRAACPKMQLSQFFGMLGKGGVSADLRGDDGAIHQQCEVSQRCGPGQHRSRLPTVRPNPPVSNEIYAGGGRNDLAQPHILHVELAGGIDEGASEEMRIGKTRVPRRQRAPEAVASHRLGPLAISAEKTMPAMPRLRAPALLSISPSLLAEMLVERRLCRFLPGARSYQTPVA